MNLRQMVNERMRREKQVDPEVMTPLEAAEYLRMGRATLLKYAREGKVPCAQIGGRIRFSASALKEFLENRD